MGCHNWPFNSNAFDPCPVTNSIRFMPLMAHWLYGAQLPNWKLCHVKQTFRISYNFNLANKIPKPLTFHSTYCVIQIFIFNAIYIFKQIQLWIEIMEFLISEEKNIIIWLKKFLNSKIFFIVYFKKNNKILQEVKHNEIFFFSLICKNHWDQIDSKIQIFIFPLKSYL